MRVVIIGAVAAGMSAAAKLKRSKPEYDVIVYEKTDVVSFGACGLPYFVGGFFDDPNNMIARAPEKFRESGIDLNIFNEVISVDTENKKLKVKNVNTGETFIDSYDKLMIATGASSIIPPIKNVKLENVSTLKSLDDGVKVKELMNKDEIKKIAIIGAGFIGLEAVEAAKKLGKEVVVFQLEDRIYLKYLIKK
ncbi:pyridine nucleotide-disulfide oxidoreductase family protein [[Clostridium] sordellii ATCC 9714]|nr:pyridine nucleotide-disulfide oxidoreductase family protein [[Clostridium] sordellii ATCC 9714] [Paeniclostridium sordellii ATCC 9714]